MDTDASVRGTGAVCPGEALFSALVAYRKPGSRPPRRLPRSAPAVALAAALVTVLPAAACTASPANSGASGSAVPRGSASAAITAAQARQVWDHYVAVSAARGNSSGTLALETGPQRAYDTASMKEAPVSGEPADSGYNAPTFVLPAQSGYPRCFVVEVTQKVTSGSSAASVSGNAEAGRELKLFEQASASAPWLLASTSRLTGGVTLPKLATDGAGFVETVAPTTAALLAQPDDVGPLQAALVDDGPASAASKVVASGQLTTGMYQAALHHASGLTAPRGDVYQWGLDGVSFPEFALRTAAGGALVFYAMSLNITVAVPDVIDKGNPIHPGPPIPVPGALRALLPPSQTAPLVQLQAQQTLSFAAVDPAPGSAKIAVIAMGGGLTSASAS